MASLVALVAALLVLVGVVLVVKVAPRDGPVVLLDVAPAAAAMLLSAPPPLAPPLVVALARSRLLRRLVEQHLRLDHNLQRGNNNQSQLNHFLIKKI